MGRVQSAATDLARLQQRVIEFAQKGDALSALSGLASLRQTTADKETRVRDVRAGQVEGAQGEGRGRKSSKENAVDMPGKEAMDETIAALNGIGDGDSARILTYELMERELGPDKATHYATLRAVLRTGRAPDRAVKQLVRSGALNNVVRRAYLENYANRNDFAQAELILDKLAERKGDVGHGPLIAVLTACGREGKGHGDLALRAFSQLQRKTRAAFTSVITSLVSDRRTSEARAIFADLDRPVRHDRGWRHYQPTAELLRTMAKAMAIDRDKEGLFALAAKWSQCADRESAGGLPITVESLEAILKANEEEGAPWSDATIDAFVADCCDGGCGADGSARDERSSLLVRARVRRLSHQGDPRGVLRVISAHKDLFTAEETAVERARANISLGEYNNARLILENGGAQRNQTMDKSVQYSEPSIVSLTEDLVQILEVRGDVAAAFSLAQWLHAKRVPREVVVEPAQGR